MQPGKNTIMIAHDHYEKLIINFQALKENRIPMTPKIKSSLQLIGSFLRSRSSQFEVLENQEDISVFLSICKSEKENLILVFNYFLSDSLIMQNKKVSASEFLKKMLEDFNKAVSGPKVSVEQREPQSEFRVISSNDILEKRMSVKKSRA